MSEISTQITSLLHYFCTLLSLLFYLLWPFPQWDHPTDEYRWAKISEKPCGIQFLCFFFLSPFLPFLIWYFFVYCLKMEAGKPQRIVHGKPRYCDS